MFCQISIDGAEYTVLWKWELLPELPDDVDSFSEGWSVISCIPETDMSDDISDTSIGDVNLGDNVSDNETYDDDDDIPIYPTLPFKVMGVAHTNQSRLKTRDRLTLYAVILTTSTRKSEVTCSQCLQAEKLWTTSKW